MKFLAAVLLFIFPVCADYTTYIGDTYGGGGPYPIADLRTTAMTTDKAGNTYLTGTRNWDTTKTSATPRLGAFVTKLDVKGNNVFTKVFGGSGYDVPAAIAVDPSGNVYVAGITSSADLLVTNALHPAPGNSFIVKFSADGNTVLYSTYWGDYYPGGYRSTTQLTAIATDSLGSLYITGTTGDADYPVTPGMPQDKAFSGYNYAAFVTKISAAGDKIVYSGTVTTGGAAPCSPCGILLSGATGVGVGIDAAGNAYVAGYASGLPAVIQGEAHPAGAFVMKIKADGSGLAYVNNFGFTNPSTNLTTMLNSIAVDAAGNAYLAGSTSDPYFPATPGAYQTTISGAVNAYGVLDPDAFAAKLSPDGSTILWATYVGGTGNDTANSVAADANGNVWIVGTTDSTQFPNANGWSSGNEFLVGINASGTSLTYAGRYPTGTVAQGVGLDSTAGFVHAAGNAGIVVGITPAKLPATLIYGLTNAAGGETTGRIAGGEVVSIYGPNIGPSSPVVGVPDSSGNYPTTLGGVNAISFGQNMQLLYVSSSQINAIIPFPSGVSTMQIVNGAATSAAFPLVSVQDFPEVFRNPDGSAVALNQDGTINSQSNRAALGSEVQIFVSGAFGGAINLYAAGAPGPVAQQLPIISLVGGQFGGVTRAGFRLPGVEPPVISWTFSVVTMYSYASDPFTLWVE
jgi:uncharacterized protein (TIGR03437 family)